MGTGGNFDVELDVVRDPATSFHIVKAGGPLDPSVVRVIELCVWVFQRAEASNKVNDIADDAIANAMGPEKTPETPEDMDCVKVTRDPATNKVVRWDMDLKDRDETGPIDFVNGSATAIAIGAFLHNTPAGEEKHRAFVWSEPVWLKVKGGVST